MTRLSIALLFTASLWAGDAVRAASPAPKTKVKTVVRIDPKTGRLVRSSYALAERASAPAPLLPVMSAPIASTPVAITPRAVEPFVVVPRNITTSGLVAPTPKALRISLPPARIREIVEEKSRQHGLDPLLVHSVIRAESNYNPYAISPKGAEGLMQLIPSTAKQFGVQNSFDPEQNIEGGIRYLKHLQTLFTDERLVLAAYNAGEGAVTKYGWIPPYAETQDYVHKVGRYYGVLRQEQSQNPKPIVPLLKIAPMAPVLQEFVDGEGRIHITLRQVND